MYKSSWGSGEPPWTSTSWTVYVRLSRGAARVAPVGPFDIWHPWKHAGAMGQDRSHDKGPRYLAWPKATLNKENHKPKSQVESHREFATEPVADSENTHQSVRRKLMVQTHELQTVKALEGAGVDLEALKAAADVHAFHVWGEQVAHGDSLPVCGTTGDTTAVVFPYVIGARTFPPMDSFAETCRDPKLRFGTVFVSAHKMDHPILGIVHALHPLFVNYRKALEIGQTKLGADAQVSRIYWLGLDREYFDIATPNQRILLDVHTLEQVDPQIALQACPAKAPMRTGAMPEIAPPSVPVRAVPLAAAGAAVLKLVPFDASVPAVDWTWWCAPTAWTMATCYYDNFTKGTGGILGYGRLVGYWMEDPKSGHNVPDFLDQLIDPNTGNWRTGFTGYSDFIQKTYGYTFATRDVKATSANDWAWADIKDEIDAGRPFVWGVIVGSGTEPDHAACAFGYRITDQGAKYVVVHTTWGGTDAVQRQEWLYTLGIGGLTAITPGGGTPGQDAVLWTPNGGETYLTNVAVTVQWHVWGDQIKTAQLLHSVDGGNTWTPIALAAPCVPGWNYYTWKPQQASNRARLRIRCLGANGTYIAGDGSHANFTVLPGPMPVTLKTILIKTSTDTNGFFSAQHGLKGGDVSYAIRGVLVSVQHKNGNWHTLEISNAVDNRFWWNNDLVQGVINSPNFYNQPVQIAVFAETIVG